MSCSRDIVVFHLQHLFLIRIYRSPCWLLPIIWKQGISTYHLINNIFQFQPHIYSWIRLLTSAQVLKLQIWICILLLAPFLHSVQYSNSMQANRIHHKSLCTKELPPSIGLSLHFWSYWMWSLFQEFSYLYSKPGTWTALLAWYQSSQVKHLIAFDVFVLSFITHFSCC